MRDSSYLIPQYVYTTIHSSLRCDAYFTSILLHILPVNAKNPDCAVPYSDSRAGF